MFTYGTNFSALRTLSWVLGKASLWFFMSITFRNGELLVSFCGDFEVRSLVTVVTVITEKRISVENLHTSKNCNMCWNWIGQRISNDRETFWIYAKTIKMHEQKILSSSKWWLVLNYVRVWFTKDGFNPTEVLIIHDIAPWRRGWNLPKRAFIDLR